MLFCERQPDRPGQEGARPPRVSRHAAITDWSASRRRRRLIAGWISEQQRSRGRTCGGAELKLPEIVPLVPTFGLARITSYRKGRRLLQRSKIAESVRRSGGGRRKHLVAEGSLPVEALDKRGIDERCEIQIARFGVGVANHFEKDLHGVGIA